MEFYKGYTVNPERFRVPSFSISPFSNDSLIAIDNIIEQQSQANNHEVTNFFGDHFRFTLNGKEAIYLALSAYGLKQEDEVLIVTSSANKYVSSCVTGEIEKFCKWSRDFSEKTKVIFVVHEFGKLYPDLDKIKTYGLPIIEDLAMSMFSASNCKGVGKLGDFTIFSLPKFFPVQFGGVLQINNKNFISNELHLDKKPEYTVYLEKITEHFLQKKTAISSKRRENYAYFRSKLLSLGFTTRLEPDSNEVPSVFMFSDNNTNFDNMKVFLQSNGVECSKFYGENSFFIPVHQNLSVSDMNYIINLIEYFKNNEIK